MEIAQAIAALQTAENAQAALPDVPDPEEAAVAQDGFDDATADLRARLQKRSTMQKLTRLNSIQQFYSAPSRVRNHLLISSINSMKSLRINLSLSVMPSPALQLQLK